MAQRPLFDVTIGNEARGKEHIRFNLHYVPTYSQADKNRMIEQGKGDLINQLSRWVIPSSRNASEYSNRYRLVAVQQTMQAFRDLTPEQGGGWRRFGIEADEGEIFCISAYYKDAVMGSVPQQANMMIRTRAKGPMQRIYMDLLQVPDKSLFQRAFFEGHFDIIDLPTAIRAGAHYGQNAATLFNKPLERCSRLQCIVLQPELEKPVTVSVTEVIDADGSVMEVARPRRRRVMQGLE